MSDRHSYVLHLEITPQSPLVHGAGSAGNETLLRTVDRLAWRDDQWEVIQVPQVSGASLRATLREYAVRYYLRALGVEPGTVSRDALRLLLKGGRTSSGSQSVSLDRARQLRALFPPLAVWGSMDGGLPIRGRLQVTEVVPYAEELIDSMPDLAGAVYTDRAPIPLRLAWGDPVTYYRHDLGTSQAAVYLEGAEVRQIEDLRAEVAAQKKDAGSAKKEERRAANESMPHSYQCIRANTPMVATLRLTDATLVEFACLGLALASWRADGGWLGAARAKGLGQCTIRLAHAHRCTSAGPVPVSADMAGMIRIEDAPSLEDVRDAYHAHVESLRDEALAMLAEA